MPQSDLNVVMLVPGIVVSELDYQKNHDEGIALDSRRASEWLASEIGSGKGQVKGQAYSQTMLLTGDWRKRSGVSRASNEPIPSACSFNVSQLSNDELILDCCKYFTHVKRKDVLLCTSDNNLAVHAASNGALQVKSYTGKHTAILNPWQPRACFSEANLL